METRKSGPGSPPEATLFEKAQTGCQASRTYMQLCFTSGRLSRLIPWPVANSVAKVSSLRPGRRLHWESLGRRFGARFRVLCCQGRDFGLG